MRLFFFVCVNSRYICSFHYANTGRMGNWIKQHWTILFCFSQIGAHHNAVHRFPRADIQLVLCLPGRKGLRRTGRTDGLPQLCGRPVVGRDNSDHHWLRRYGAANVDGENCGVVLQRICDFVLCTSSGERTTCFLYFNCCFLENRKLTELLFPECTLVFK